MANELHPIFQQILDALPQQIERERNKITPPKQRSPWQYMEQHESAEELGIKHSDYGMRGWF
jgi:2-iminoacetate synthase ThiH